MTATLTSREREVVVLVARGFTNKEIARSMLITSATVKCHVASILDKLEARSRAQAVAIAIQNLGVHA